MTSVLDRPASRTQSSQNHSVADAPPSFDAMLGLDMASANATIASFFSAVPAIFTKTFGVDQAGITTVQVVIQQPPTLAAGATEMHMREARELVASFPIDEAEAEAAVAAITDAMLNASFPSLGVTMNGGATPVVVTATATCNAAVAVNVDLNTLFLVLGDATITVPGEPVFSQVLTDFIAPLLMDYLNQAIVDGIQIPILSLFGVTFTTPVVTNENAGDNFIVAYTGLAPVVVPQPGMQWPTGTAFAGVDANALNTVANAKLPSPSNSGGIDHPNLSWDYNVTLNADVQLQPGAGNAVTVQLGVNGSADITFHTPDGLPNISFGGSISGTAVATAQLTASQSGTGQDIYLTILDAGDFDLSLSINGLPGFLNWILGPLTSAFLDALAPFIAQVLQNFPIHVTSLPAIPFSILGNATSLVLNNLQLSQAAGPDGVALAMITATPSFTPAAAVAARTSYTVTPGRAKMRGKAAR